MDFALKGDFSLYELAEFIIDSIGFHFDHCFEFCDNPDSPYKSRERYTLFADIGEGEGEPGVQRTSMADVFSEGRTMLLLFDYGDDWEFPLTCTGVREVEGKRRSKKVLATDGQPPVQYPDIDDEWEDGDDETEDDESADSSTVDQELIDQAVLAMLYLNMATSASAGPGRAWKSLDWDSLDRLHAKGLISNPSSKAKSVMLSERGLALAETAFNDLLRRKPRNRPN